jgi:hypothetical protein
MWSLLCKKSWRLEGFEWQSDGSWLWNLDRAPECMVTDKAWDEEVAARTSVFLATGSVGSKVPLDPAEPDGDGLEA